MSFQNYWYLVKKRIFHNKFMLILNILLSAVALFFLAFSIGMPQTASHGKRGIEKSLAKNIEFYGVMDNRSADTYQNEHIDHYLARLCEAEEIDGAGMWSYFPLGDLQTKDAARDYWGEMVKLHNAGRKVFREDGDSTSIQSVMVSHNAMSISKFPLLKGEKDKEYPEEMVQLYLGYNFRDIPVGTVFSSGEGEYYFEYVVAGIMEQGSVIMDGMISDTNGFTLSYVTPVDNMIVLRMRSMDRSYFTAANFFSVAEGYTYEEAALKVKEISDQYGIAVETEMLAHRMQRVMSVTDWILAKIGTLGIFLCVLSIFILFSVQILTLLHRKDEFGIWIYCGISKRQLMFVLFLENLIKLFCSAGIAFVLLHLYWKVLQLEPSVSYELRFVFLNICLEILLFSFGMAVVSSVVPEMLIAGKPLQALVKGDWKESRVKKRFFCDTSLVSWIFLLSMALSFLTMYYGLDLFRQERAVQRERKKGTYEESYEYNIVYREEVWNARHFKIPEIEKGNLFVGIRVPVGDETVHTDPVELLFVQKEEFLETIFYEESYLKGEVTGEPMCIVGSRYWKEIFYRNGNPYLKICNIPCRVVGRYQEATLANIDNRMLVFADSLSENELEKLLFFENRVYFRYRKAKKEADSEKELFFAWGDEIYAPDSINPRAKNENARETYDDGSFYQAFMPFYQKVFAGMLGLCFLNCVFLAYTWGHLHYYEYMLKRTLGYTGGQILREITGRYLLYEALAFAAVMAAVLLYEQIFRQLSFWADALAGGFGLVAVSFAVFGLVLAFVPLFWIMRQKPANVLKCNE